MQDKSSEGTKAAQTHEHMPREGRFGTPPLWQVVFGSLRAAEIWEGFANWVGGHVPCPSPIP